MSAYLSVRSLSAPAPWAVMTLAAAAALAAMVLATPPAASADLSEDRRYAGRDGYPVPQGPDENGPDEADDDYAGYDDGPAYGDGDDRAAPYADADRYSERWQGSTKDSYAPPPEPRRYSERYDEPRYAPPPRRYAERYAERYDAPPRCLPRWQIVHRLGAGGWAVIRPFDRRGPAVVTARRLETGRVYRLRIDRCSGDIVAVHPHYLRSFRADTPRPWRHAHRY